MSETTINIIVSVVIYIVVVFSLISGFSQPVCWSVSVDVFGPYDHKYRPADPITTTMKWCIIFWPVVFAGLPFVIFASVAYEIAQTVAAESKRGIRWWRGLEAE